MTEATEKTPIEQITDLAQYLVAGLVPEDADVKINARERRGEVTVQINADSAYRGAIIGKSGVIVRALRQVLSAGRFGDGISRIDVDIAD